MSLPFACFGFVNEVISGWMWGQMLDVRVTRGSLHHQTITSGDRAGRGEDPLPYISQLFYRDATHQPPSHAPAARGSQSVTCVTHVTAEIL